MSWVVSMASPGFITGSILTRYTSDLYGRRNSVLISAVPIIMGTVLVIFAKVPWLLYVVRYLWGIKSGFIQVAISMYVAEIADKEIRGSLSLIARFMYNFGTLLVMVIGSFVSYDTKGNIKRARDSLKRIRRYKDPKMLEDELNQLQADVKRDMQRSGTATELFTGKTYRRAIIIATSLKIIQMMSGSLTIQQYLGRIMQDSNTNMNLSTVFIMFGSIRFIVSIMSSVLADRVGRRPLLIYSYLGTSFSLFFIGGYFFLIDVIKLERDTMIPYGFVPFTGIIVASVISTLGYNSIMTAITGEIFPLNIKAVALTYISILGGVLSFITTRGYQFVRNELGLCGVFWIFTLISVAGIVFSAKYVPETKGKSLSEIQKMLQGKEFNDDAVEKLKVVRMEINKYIENRS